MPVESTSELLKHYEVYETIGSGNYAFIMLLYNTCLIASEILFIRESCKITFN